jgi:hypothetical protein
VSALLGVPDPAPVKEPMLVTPPLTTYPLTLLLLLYAAGGDHSVPQQMTLGLADTAEVKLFNSVFQELPLPVSLGSIRILIEESPI